MSELCDTCRNLVFTEDIHADQVRQLQDFGSQNRECPFCVAFLQCVLNEYPNASLASKWRFKSTYKPKYGFKELQLSSEDLPCKFAWYIAHAQVKLTETTAVGEMAD